MAARTRPEDTVTIMFERLGEPGAIRIAVPADKALVRVVALLLAFRDLRPGDTLNIAAGAPED